MDSNTLQATSDTYNQQTPSFARNWCFFLDIDGTLLEFAERPDAVCVDARLKTILSNLRQAAGGAVALISGRTVADIDQMFAPLCFAAAGQHGIERRDSAGRFFIHAVPAARLHDAVGELERLVAQHAGLVFENKGMTLAVHYRLAPQLGPLVADFMRDLRNLLGEQFELLAGKMLLEIKPNGKHKGTAIAEFMHERPFLERIPVFIGDDVTDEFGFALVNSRHGHTVKVGPGRTAAGWRLADANAVRAWLEAYADQYTSPGSA